MTIVPSGVRENTNGACRDWECRTMGQIVIIGGGPGGYEAALVAAQLDAEVTIVECEGIGGACVLTDCVPSKTLIATSDVMTSLAGSDRLGVHVPDPAAGLDLPLVNARVRELAQA